MTFKILTLLSSLMFREIAMYSCLRKYQMFYCYRFPAVDIGISWTIVL